MRVLVVDQSPERGEALKTALRQAGCEIAAAPSSPLDLLEAIASAAPDVVVIDADAIQALVRQLAQATRRLEERALVERAKGVLMKARGLDEEQAYRTLRRMAMDQQTSIGEVARSVIGMAHLLR